MIQDVMYIVDPYRFGSANGLLTSLQAYYGMEGVAGAGETDSTGSYNLSLSGSVGSQTGKNGNARGAFSSTSNYLSTSSGPTFSASTATSISAWIYFPSSPSSYQTFVSIGGQNSGDRKIDLRIDNASHFQLNMEKCQIAGNQATWGSTFTTSTRYHVVVTYDGANNGKLYVDNGSAATGTFGSSGTTSDTKILIGGTLYDGGGGFMVNNAANAYVDEVAIWNKVLSTTDVSNLYNGGSGLFYASFN